MDNNEREAYAYGGLMGAEYLKEIKKTDLSILSAEEWEIFCECMCKNYHNKLIDIKFNLG